MPLADKITDASEGLATLRETMPRSLAQWRLAAIFRDHGMDTPELDARILLCAALQIDHAGLVRDPDLALGSHCGDLRGLAERRLLGEPVSRIIGVREFWGQRFALSPDVLDPRPDTETVVETVLAHAATEPLRAWRILDLGVGSGAILGALLGHLPHSTGIGVDISFEACVIAKMNLQTLGLGERSSIICGYWLNALSGRFDIIVSNPPYIATAMIDALAPDVRNYDPPGALDGGADGLDAYRVLAPAICKRLAQDGIGVVEIGAGQSQGVKELFLKAGTFDFNIRSDLSGRRRAILFRAGAHAAENI
jgi:release factor glutamine methyltransferase